MGSENTKNRPSSDDEDVAPPSANAPPQQRSASAECADPTARGIVEREYWPPRALPHTAQRTLLVEPDPTRDYTSYPSSYLLSRMNYNTICEVLSWLEFRVVARDVRPTCKYIHSLAHSDDYWALLCSNRNIHGELVDPEDLEPDARPEPHPYLQMDGPLESNESTLTYQLAISLWANRDWDGCPHLTEDVLRAALPNWLRQINLSNRKKQTSTGCEVEDAQVTCRVSGCTATLASGAWVCVHCAKRYCGRSQLSHTLSHGCTDVVAAKDDANDLYCYTCNKSLQGHFSDHSVRKESPLVPQQIVRALLTQRNQRERVNHLGLFLRNQCPHLDEHRLRLFASYWEAHKTRIVNDSCDHVDNVKNRNAMPMMRRSGMGGPWDGHCKSRKVYVCVDCCRQSSCSVHLTSMKPFVGCGAARGGHMWKHCMETGHNVIIAVRRLDVWCYSCDRYIGVGGTKEDYLQMKRLQTIVATGSGIYHHKASCRPWEPIVEDACGFPDGEETKFL